MQTIASQLTKTIPARVAVDAVFKRNKNKLFTALDVYTEMIKLAPISYTAMCTCLMNFPSVRLRGTYKLVYGHPTVLKKLRKEIDNPEWESKFIAVPPFQVITRTFNKFKSRPFTPSELYTEVKDTTNITKNTLKACLENNFPRISLSRKNGYYGHDKALRELERYFKRNKIAYTLVKNRRNGK